MSGLKSSHKTRQKSSKILHNIPSGSQIAPLPENTSHGMLPVLSLDGRNSPKSLQADNQSVLNTEITIHSNGLQAVGE